MIDLILAVYSRRTCGWCNLRKYNRFEHWIGGDLYLGDEKRWQRIAWWLYADLPYKIGIWRLGEWWHWHVHVHDKDVSPQS